MKLPNFLVIGAAKAGTSSLYNYLNQHRQIYMCPVKEPHFFAFEGKEINFQGPGDSNRLRNAVIDFDSYCKLFQNASNEIAIGDRSTTYLYSSKAPERIKYYIPDVKIIAILRNPAEVAYSSFCHLIRDGDEQVFDFVKALQEEETRIRNNWAGLWHYRQRGFYYVQLKRYFEHFERKQIQVYLYEDLRNNPVKLLQDIFVFLNVDDSFVPNTSTRYNVSGIPKNKALHNFLTKPNLVKYMLKSFVPEEISHFIHTIIRKQNLNVESKLSPDIRQQLLQEYQTDILKLQELIDQDLSGWLT